MSVESGEVERFRCLTRGRNALKGRVFVSVNSISTVDSTDGAFVSCIECEISRGRSHPQPAEP